MLLQGLQAAPRPLAIEDLQMQLGLDNDVSIYPSFAILSLLKLREVCSMYTHHSLQTPQNLGCKSANG